MVEPLTAQQHQVPVIEQAECQRCGFKWFPRVKTPIACPQCNSRSWAGNKERGKANTYPQQCLRCGYEWTSPKETPKSCPSCRSRVWHEERVIYPEKTCLQCGYKWFSRYEHSPVCPACQRFDWNTEYPDYGDPDKLVIDSNYKSDKKQEEITETTLPTPDEESQEQAPIMESIEKRLGTSEAKGDNQAITEKEEHWVEVKSSVVLGVEGKRETRIVNKDEMRKLTGK